MLYREPEIGLEAMGFLPATVEAERAGNGEWRLRNPAGLGDVPPTLLHPIAEQALLHPEKPAISEQCSASGEWTCLDYGTLWRRVAAVSAWLRDRDPGPVALLSGASIAHLVVRLAAMASGRVAAPISPSYSLLDKNFTVLRPLLEELAPAIVFAEDDATYGSALSQSGGGALPVVGRPSATAVLSLADIEGEYGDSAPPALAGLDPDIPSQILYTSGSTGRPKGVVHTQRNIVVNVAQVAGMCGETMGPASQEVSNWLPWHHVSGTGTLFIALAAGSHFVIDPGKPVGDEFAKSLATLRRVSLKSYVSVPIGYSALVNALEADEDLAARYFRDLDFVIYGGAGIGDDVLRRFQTLAQSFRGREVPFVSAYGSTETGGTVMMTPFAASQAGLLGLPVPGVEVRLFPFDDNSWEFRVKGDNVTAGYLTPDENLFDEEGFLRTGDLVSWCDPERPALGLRFLGRLAEQFKLDTGTWVSSGALRDHLLQSLKGIASAAVICGADRPFVAALLWLDERACRELDNGFDPLDPAASRPIVGFLQEMLSRFNADASGSSNRVVRAKLMIHPLSAADGEISDKGSINARRVLLNRSDDVEALYSVVAETDVIEASVGAPAAGADR